MGVRCRTLTGREMSGLETRTSRTNKSTLISLSLHFPQSHTNVKVNDYNLDKIDDKVDSSL